MGSVTDLIQVRRPASVSESSLLASEQNEVYTMVYTEVYTNH